MAKEKTPKWSWDEARYGAALGLYQALSDDVRASQDANRDAMQSIADELAERFGFDEVKPKSVISKLSSMGDYVKPEKAVAKPRDEGPSKKDIMAALRAEGPEGFDEVSKGFETASKPALQYLAELLEVRVE